MLRRAAAAPEAGRRLRWAIDLGVAGCAKTEAKQGKKLGFQRVGKPPAFDPAAADVAADTGAAAAKKQFELPTGGSARNYGDDAVFVADLDKALCFGVADGVGGWRKHGVDPSEFSYALMSGVCSAVCAHQDGEGGSPSPSPGAALQRGYDWVVDGPAGPRVEAGSSTAVIASIDCVSGELSLANIGDSSWLVIRNGKVINESEEQRHTFFTPLQLSVAPEGHSRISDLPCEADLESLRLKHGDLVVLCTDGLSDNLFEDELLAQLASFEYDCPPSEIAETIVRSCVRFMKKDDRMSPFASRAQEEGFCILGGKMDDVTVCVARARCIAR